jgi:hypothetical protein
MSQVNESNLSVNLRSASMSESLIRAMDEVAKANRERGVPQRGGKRYTMVQDRVLVWRRHFGLEHGIETQVTRDDGEIIQIRCIIRDASGRELADGWAEEVRGSSNVNKTSALENCETSALGRALAKLGLHGGEFASANEMDKVERMESVPPVPAPPPAAEPTVIVDNIEDTLVFDEPKNWSSWVGEQIEGFEDHRTTAQHKQWSSTVKVDRERLAREDPALHSDLLSAYAARKRELENRSE